MAPRFSLIYPTRHRPDFVAQALSFVRQQGAPDDFEVIVCDNFIDPTLSCERVCRESGLTNIRYVRPPTPLGMVDNWNYAVQFATGEYVCIFTDKIFMLPGALDRISRALTHMHEPEIISWVSDAFQPSRYPDYFGAGEYTATQADEARAAPAAAYDPLEALRIKCRGDVSRYEQSPSQYCRGKMVFGAYSRELISRIVAKYGQLFLDISPDYTSMVLALAEATSACELSSSAVVSIATDISNGVLTSTNDALSLKYLKLLSGDMNDMMANTLVPGLYASQANIVSHDYLAVQRRFGIDVTLDVRNWLVYCIEDLSRPDRVWSCAEVEQEQTNIMHQFVGALAPNDQSAVISKLESRFDARNRGALAQATPGQRLSWP
ncbi:MAG: glycosyltransferase family A protein, partial [Gemmatimonadaceae bacterium]